MVETGVAFGRFQILHSGHIEYLLEAKKQCKHLLIGVSNPDPGLTKFDETCPHRSSDSSNPLTFYERLKMIQGAMIECGIKKDEFTVVPLPINFPQRIKYYVPDDSVFFLTIYDDWGWRRKAVLEELGYQTSVLWVRSDESRITSGTELREKIVKNEGWKHLVPGSVYQFITENGLDNRIRLVAAPSCE